MTMEWSVFIVFRHSLESEFVLRIMYFVFYSDTYVHRDDTAVWLFLLEISLLYFAIIAAPR